MAPKRPSSSGSGPVDSGPGDARPARSRPGRGAPGGSTPGPRRRLRPRDTEAARKPASTPRRGPARVDHAPAQKLQKLLAAAGLGSRRELENLIAAGRVSVNGQRAALGDRARGHDVVRVDGRTIDLNASGATRVRVLAYHKPIGEVCTRYDPDGRPTVFEKLPGIRRGRWIGIGRLDVNTSGLLLFTNSGELANRLMHPSHGVERRYAVRVFGSVDPQSLRQLLEGVTLEDGPARFASIEEVGGEGRNHWYEVSLAEGRNREVRRLWEAVGVQVSRLSRIRFATVNLDRRVRPGRWEEISEEALQQLLASVGMQPAPTSRAPGAGVRRRSGGTGAVGARDGGARRGGPRSGGVRAEAERGTRSRTAGTARRAPVADAEPRSRNAADAGALEGAGGGRGVRSHVDRGDRGTRSRTAGAARRTPAAATRRRVRNAADAGALAGSGGGRAARTHGLGEERSERGERGTRSRTTGAASRAPAAGKERRARNARDPDGSAERGAGRAVAGRGRKPRSTSGARGGAAATPGRRRGTNKPPARRK
ncbi:MAG: pseudouridine synthase [Gammaproteobacteria bacterium]|nr:pseudouridine synthase [Gammaproteobacteria bacterium]